MTRFAPGALLLTALVTTLAGCGGGGGGVTPSPNAPTLTQLTASSASPGTAVNETLAGTNFTPTTTVTISQAASGSTGVQVSNIQFVSPTQITATFTVASNATPGARTVKVNTVAGSSNALTFNILSTVTLPRPTTAKWTVLVYLNASNNLEPFSIENVNQMEQASYSSDVNIVVQWKRWHGAGAAAQSEINEDHIFDPADPDFDGTRRYWLHGRGGSGAYQQDMVQDMGSGPAGGTSLTTVQSVDMGSPQVLRDFMTWGRANFPAQHFLVVLWNHGAGWEHRAVNRAAASRGISYDDANNSSIETWQLPDAFAGNPPVDEIAMDASLMQMAEVDDELKNVTSYVVGSEDSPPGDGYPYELWMGALTQNPNITAVDIGKSIVDTFGAWYTNNLDSSGQSDSVTQSLVSTSALPALTQAIDNLGTVLFNDRVTYAQAFGVARENANQYAIENGTTIYGEYKDLVQYVNLLEQSAAGAPGLQAAGDQVKNAVAQAVLDNIAIRGDSFSHGVSIYVPEPGQYLTSFGNLTFATAAPHWAAWLQNQLQ
jgi:hypothetical protein